MYGRQARPAHNPLMDLKATARETLAILEAGRYHAPSGAERSIGTELAAAVAGTRLYTPEALAALLAALPPAPTSTSVAPARIEVTSEATQGAAQRLVLDEGVVDPVLLDFASAKNAGGGFITGARAQEEDLCRCSGLYPCIRSQPVYFQANRANGSLLYTDHAIWAPRVPWFRSSDLRFLEQPYLASVIVSPAPNAGEVLARDAGAGPAIEAALRQRIDTVLAIARDAGHRTLVLGAWGCGVFRNDPHLVAAAFDDSLRRPAFAGAFDRVVFAVYDRSRDQTNLGAFRARFGTEDAART